MSKSLNEPFFIDHLIDKIKEKKSHVVVGLDPVFEYLPSSLRNKSTETLNDACKAIVEFNKKVIDAVHDLVPAIKPQIAFYERFGIAGIDAFLKTVKYGKKRGLIVIEDAKRNDIGSTATAYSEGHIGKVKINRKKFSVFNVDAITVTPYLGSDGILPFIKDAKRNKKGVFVLVKTSNPSSREIQDQIIIQREKKQKLYEMIGILVDKWGEEIIGKSGYSSVGAVVGATFPRVAKALRKLMPKAYFLVPGYGAQGGKATDIVACFNEDGLGALIAASRSINYAFRQSKKFAEHQFAEAARKAVEEMNNDINNTLQRKNLINWSV